MFASGWPITFLLFRLFGSVTSSPVHSYTPVPPLPLQISPPSPVPSDLQYPSSSLGGPHPTTSFTSSFGESANSAHCPLTVSPSSLVVRFEDPVTANCSQPAMEYLPMGWEVDVTPAPFSMDNFVVWREDRMTAWNLKPVCFALSEQRGQCKIELPLTVYKPPDNVSISFFNHSGPMSEGRQYTLQCEVQNVAPVENLTVTFYKGQSALRQLQSSNTEKTPVTEVFTMDIVPRKEDDGVQYWCAARLELGPEGPKPTPVVMSEELNATVLFGPHLLCPTKLQVREGESLICEVRGNPQPLVTWYRDGQRVALPSHSNREHAGKYTARTSGYFGHKNFTVVVDVLTGSGTASSCNRYFLLAVLFIQMINWL